MNENQDSEDIWRERARTILNEDPEKTDLLIEEMKKLVKNEKNLVVPDKKDFYLKFLRAGLSDPNQGFEIMKNFFILKAKGKYFESATDLEKLVKTTFSQQIHCMLPNRDAHGRRIYVFRPGRWDPDKIPFTDVFCVGYMLSELVTEEPETQIAGLVSITDATGFGLKHLRAIGLEDGKNLAAFFNISFPVWMRMSHVINTPRLFNMLMNMVRPFTSENVRNNITIHTNDLSTLRDYFSGDILPSDLGGNGTMGPMDNSHNVEQLREMKKYFEEILQYGYKEE